MPAKPPRKLDAVLAAMRGEDWLTAIRLEPVHLFRPIVRLEDRN